MRLMEQMNSYLDVEVPEGGDRDAHIEKFLTTRTKSHQIIRGFAVHGAIYYTVEKDGRERKDVEIWELIDLNNQPHLGEENPARGKYKSLGLYAVHGDYILKSSSGEQTLVGHNRTWGKAGNLIGSMVSLASMHRELTGAFPNNEPIKTTVEDGHLVLRRQTRSEREVEQRKRDIRTRLEIMRQQRKNKAAGKDISSLINDISRAAQKAYPGKWEVTQKLNRVKLTIHFPEVHMTNTNHESHTIRDMFMSIYVDYDGKVLEGIKGERATISLAEWMSNFVHPHLPFNRDLSGSQFCMSDNNIEQLMSDLRRKSYFTEGKRTSWIRRFTAILFQMEAYMSWESLEGTRYSSIKNISVKGREHQFDIKLAIKQTIQKAMESETSPPMRYVKGEGFVLADDTEEFEDWLSPLATHTQYRDDKNQFYVDTTEGIPTESFCPDGSKPIVFKGKTYTKMVLVEQNGNEKKEKGKKYCHRAIKDEFVKQINRQLTEEYRRKCVRQDFRAELERAKKKPLYHTFNGKSEADNQSYGLLKTFKTVPDVPGPGVVRDTVLQD